MVKGLLHHCELGRLLYIPIEGTHKSLTVGNSFYLTQLQ